MARTLLCLLVALCSNLVQAHEARWLLQTSLFTAHYNPEPDHNNYAGRRFDMGEGMLFAKLTGGLLHGYRGEQEDKIPFNKYGIAPAVIPSLGLQSKVLTSELVFLGTAAILVNMGIQF